MFFIPLSSIIRRIENIIKFVQKVVIIKYIFFCAYLKRGVLKRGRTFRAHIDFFSNFHYGNFLDDLIVRGSHKKYFKISKIFNFI